tara:strand:- start:160 stop:882 length:723 start_codon:yes stop_codon:yes gene_type:complete
MAKKIRKALILGGSSDIGIEIIKNYLENDYIVYAHYNNNINPLKRIQKKNKRLYLYKFDFLKSEKEIYKFLNKKKFNECDIFINATAYIKSVDFQNVDTKVLFDSFKVNLLPNIILTQKLGKLMFKKKWGRIVNLGSIGVKFGGGYYNYPYSLMKHALELFPNISRNWVKRNVLINTVRIGATQTKLHKNLPKKNLSQREKLIPLKRMAKAKEIADYIFFLGSEENTYITHQVLAIAGGE